MSTLTLKPGIDIHGLLPGIEDALFSAQDRICLERARLALEAYRAHADQPPALKRALVLRHVLDHMTLDLNSNPVFAGNTSTAPRAWLLHPELGLSLDMQVKIEHDFITDEWFNKQIPADLREAWAPLSHNRGAAAPGHVAIDFSIVVNEGLRSVIARCDAHAVAGDDLARQRRQAIRLACESVIAWAHRYADAADRAADAAENPTLAACHRRVADACRHVPEHPARDLFEGLQAMLLVHLAMALEGQGLSVSVGLPDRALARFADEAAADPHASADLIRAFLIGIAANSYLGRGSKTQAVTLGGADSQGRDRCNAVTLAFLHAYRQTPVADPHCFFRWHADVDADTWALVVELLSSGRSMPLLVNDAQVAPALVDAGIAPADAWDYCIIGCNELGIPGRMCESALATGLGYNELDLLDKVVREQTERCDSTAAIVDLWETRLAEFMARGYATRRAAFEFYSTQFPMPVTSAMSHRCVEEGGDWINGMPYHLVGCFTRGTANAINALAAIEQIVFIDRRCTLAEMIAAVGARDQRMLNWIAEAPKWGNDDDRVDRFAAALGSARSRVMAGVAREQGSPPLAVCHVVRSLHHVDGRRMGATLDGREPYTPVGDSIAAICGTTTQGPTANMNSVLKIDALREFVGIYNNNLTLPGNQARPKILRPLIEGFFDGGGQELQVAVLDADKLKAARQHPERYRDLVVRIAGLNARFVELSRVEQDEIIRRAELV